MHDNFRINHIIFSLFQSTKPGLQELAANEEETDEVPDTPSFDGNQVQKHFNGWLCLVPSCLSIGDSRANDERTEVRTEDFVLVLRYNCDLRSKPFQSSYCTKEILFFILVPTFSAISHRPLDTRAIYTLMRCYAIEESVNCLS